MPGLAHFNEHMLFLGTKRFPEENSFDDFLQNGAGGGATNALTEAEDTCFYFSAGAASLAAALERFGEFFTSPLFSEGGSERELSAINNEFLTGLLVDRFRFDQLLRSRANPAHPFFKFGGGTSESLQGPNLRGALIRHYREFYRAPLMTLCILGRESTGELAEYARRYFGGIPGAPAGVTAPSDAWAGIPPFVADSFGSIINGVPVSDARVLQVSFPVIWAPSTTVVAGANTEGGMTLESWRRFKPYKHIGIVLGHEGPQSLCALLRRRGWATNLGAGVIEENETFALFKVSVDLTRAGFARRSEVLDLLFGYVRLLRELPAWPNQLLDENIMLSEANWRTTEQPAATETVLRCAGNMQKHNQPKYYLSGPGKLAGGPELPDAVTTTLKALTPSNAIVFVVSRDFASVADQSEMWYGTRFQPQPAAPQRLAWEAARPSPGLALPSPNPYVPRSLELKAPRAERTPRGAVPPPPEVRRKDNRWHVFFRQDTEFGVPKAFVCIDLLSRLPGSSARFSALSRLYGEVLSEHLREPILYDARLAGITFELSASARGLQLYFGGYDDRLVDFAQAVVASVVQFRPGVDGGSLFERQRDSLLRELVSFESAQPLQQAGYWTGLATTTPTYSVEQLASELRMVSVDDLDEFCERLLRREWLYGLALCQGNLRADEADQIIAAVDKAIPFQPLPEAEFPDPAVAQVPICPTGPGCVVVKDALDPAEENSAVEITFQGGSCRAPDGEAGRQRFARMQVLAAALQNGFYNELRTKQQLGYTVALLADKREGIIRLAMLVQGTALDPVGVLGRVDTFLRQAREELAARPSEELREFAAGIAQARLQRTSSLAEAVDISWVEIRTRDFQFRRAMEEAAALSAVSRDDILETFDTVIAEGGQARRKLATLVFGAAHREARKRAEGLLEEQGAMVVRELPAFAQAQPRWRSGTTSSGAPASEDRAVAERFSSV